MRILQLIDHFGGGAIYNTIHAQRMAYIPIGIRPLSPVLSRSNKPQN